MTSQLRHVLPLALCMADPGIVSAAETSHSTSASGTRASAGVVTEEKSTGFTIITFGIWPIQNQYKPSIHFHPNTDLPLDNNFPSYKAQNYRRFIYLPYVKFAERLYALPPGLLDALIWTESRYDPFAISNAGAIGLGQLMPATAQAVGVANRYDPKRNLEGSARYLSQMLEKFGAIHLAIAAYNAGPRAVIAAGGVPNNGETPQYVRNVLTWWRNTTHRAPATSTRSTPYKPK